METEAPPPPGLKPRPCANLPPPWASQVPLLHVTGNMGAAAQHLGVVVSSLAQAVQRSGSKMVAKVDIQSGVLQKRCYHFHLQMASGTRGKPS